MATIIDKILTPGELQRLTEDGVAFLSALSKPLLELPAVVKRAFDGSNGVDPEQAVRDWVNQGKDAAFMAKSLWSQAKENRQIAQKKLDTAEENVRAAREKLTQLEQTVREALVALAPLTEAPIGPDSVPGSQGLEALDVLMQAQDAERQAATNLKSAQAEVQPARFAMAKAKAEIMAAQDVLVKVVATYGHEFLTNSK